ncbi:MAG TPA: S8 family serine peptidase, partial [Solirubrobacteraceae bacterium]|nr:S8 family serine peptidase [Solirubrobacteraceae bacterium]
MQVARDLATDPSIAWAEPNSYQQGGSLPNDPMFGEQWALQNTGQSVNGEAGTAGDDIDATAAWERSTGSHSVLVSVVDSGINFDSPDLAPNIAPGGWDFVQNDADPSDAYGHGTHVAGIIGARGDDGLGVSGVDWNASILPVRVLNNLNTGTCATVAAGLSYAAEAGARVVNVSIYSYVHCQAEEEAIAAAPDTLFVAIAGNDGLSTNSSPTFPCTDPEPNIICVAATDQDDRLASFSNYGPGVDLAAPGTNIESTFLRWGPTETLYEDGFETSLSGRWTTSGSWDRTIQNPLHGVFSLTDSPFANYSNDDYTYAQRSLDLIGHKDCAVVVHADTALGSGDYLLGEIQPDGIDDTEPALTGTSAGYEKQYFDLAPLEGRSDGAFRFSLLSDELGVSDGAYLDDFSVQCVPVLRSYTGAPSEYEIDYGTSMAAPYVTGTAALVLSVDQALSATEVKQRILDSAYLLPSLAGKVESGGRLDAGRAVGLAPAPAPTPTGAPTPKGTSPASA